MILTFDSEDRVDPGHVSVKLTFVKRSLSLVTTDVYIDFWKKGPLLGADRIVVLLMIGRWYTILSVCRLF